jgi:hypothetical protein
MLLILSLMMDPVNLGENMHPVPHTIDLSCFCIFKLGFLTHGVAPTGIMLVIGHTITGPGLESLFPGTVALIKMPCHCSSGL